MSELKDFPTDDDYNGDPRYHEEFLKSQREFRGKIMSFTNEAGDINELDWLQNQICAIGLSQYGIKLNILNMVFNDPYLELDWDDITTPELRRRIMECDSIMPQWQRNEMIYVIDMYHDMMVEMDKIYEKRRGGQ